MTYQEMRARAVEVIRQSPLAELEDELAPLLRNAIQVSTERCDDSAVVPGSSKIGGCPDVHSGFTWPLWNDQPLTFIAQFRLEDLRAFDVEQELPSHGLLSFWSMLRPRLYPDDGRMHGEIGMIPETSGAWRVFWTPETHDIKRAALPNGYEGIAYESRVVSSFLNRLMLPDDEELPPIPEHSNRGNEYFDDEYFDLRNAVRDLEEDAGDHHLLGYAYLYQSDIRPYAAGFAAGLSYNATPDDEQAHLIAQAAPHWRLLMQLDNVHDMTWAGDGAGYFWIRDEDLLTRNFADAYFRLQR